MRLKIDLKQPPSAEVVRRLRNEVILLAAEASAGRSLSNHDIICIAGAFDYLSSAYLSKLANEGKVCQSQQS